MGCMSPLYATPPISPGSDNGPNFEDQFETPSAIFSAHNIENNDHFARDTHMRIILGNCQKEASQQSKYENAFQSTFNDCNKLFFLFEIENH